MPNAAPRRALLASVLVAGAVLVPACGGDGSSASPEASAGAGELAGVVRTPPLVVGTVTLPDAESPDERVEMRAPEGELLLVYFGYTSCPDICPTTMSDISIAIADLAPGLAERVTVGMVTVDPGRDTAAVLGGYLDHFFDRRHALRTDDAAELQAAADAFGVRFEVEPHDPASDDAYEVSHSAVTYVVDDTGTVVVEWPFGFDSGAMTADLTTLLQEENT